MEKVFALSLSEDNFQPLAPEERESFSNFKLEVGPKAMRDDSPSHMKVPHAMWRCGLPVS